MLDSPNIIAIGGFQGRTEVGFQEFQETPLDFTHYLKH